MLTAVETAINTLVTNKLASVELFGVRYAYHKLPELTAWRDKLRAQVQRQGRGLFLHSDSRT